MHDKTYDKSCEISEDSGQPVRPCQLISLCWLHLPSTAPVYPKTDKRESLQYRVDVQADLSLCWLHRSYCRLLQCAGFNLYYWNLKQFLNTETTDKLFHLALTKLIYSLNSFGAKFQTAFVVCFFILTNHRLERRLYVKLKDWMSNSIDPDETAHWAVSYGSMLFAKAYYYHLWQWKS